MKNIIIWLIELYQKMPISSHNLCRFNPTCSEYTKECVKEFGCVKGIYLGIKRIIRCRPGGSYGYDPAPKKEKL